MFKIGNNSAIMQRQSAWWHKCPKASALFYHFLLLLVLCLELLISPWSQYQDDVLEGMLTVFGVGREPYWLLLSFVT